MKRGTKGRYGLFLLAAVAAFLTLRGNAQFLADGELRIDIPNRARKTFFRWLMFLKEHSLEMVMIGRRVFVRRLHTSSSLRSRMA